MCLKRYTNFHYPNLRLGFAGAFRYEALRVPPLLPEYLSQPVQIVIQSSPDWQVWVGAGATLLGAAIGAGLGAFFSYGAAKKASQKTFALEKAEMLYALAERCRSDISKLDGFYIRAPSALHDFDGDKKRLLSEASDRFDRLYEQLHIYPCDNDIDRRGLLDAHATWRHILYKRFFPGEMILATMKASMLYGESGSHYLSAKKNYDNKLCSACDKLSKKIIELSN